MWVCQAWMLYVKHYAKSLVCINPTSSLLKCLLFSIKCTINIAHFVSYFSSGVERKFGVGVGRMEWLESENLWSLTGLDGQNLGHFQGVVASDKNIVSPRFTSVTGRPPPLGMMSLWHSLFFGGDKQCLSNTRFALYKWLVVASRLEHPFFFLARACARVCL